MSTKSYYIATGLKNAPMHAEARKVFEHSRSIPIPTIEMPWVLTYDWTKNGKINEVYRKGVTAVAEIEAIRKAWLVLVLQPGGHGTYAELGAATITGKTIIMVGPPLTEDSSAFDAHPNVHHARLLSEAREMAEMLYAARPATTLGALLSGR